MTRASDPASGVDGGDALDVRLSALEAEVYRTLIGVAEACGEIAARADALGLAPQAIRARLLASDVLSRRGRPDEGRAAQLALQRAAAPWPLLAARAAMYLASSHDRLGDRVDAIRCAQAGVAPELQAQAPAWHAEALMVAALLSVSRDGADYALVDRAMAAVRAACGPILEATTAANFAEVAAECGELVYATHYADAAEAVLRRHPEAASALSWESVARARLAAQEIAAAEHAMKASLALEERLGCCDVNGDPWLTYAEVLLARADPAGALGMLEHPRRLARGATSAWTGTRELRTRASVLAGLARWEEAYGQIVRYMAAYERSRSIEGDRAVAQSSAATAIGEERRRAQHFEQLALTDPLTGLPNRRHAERWLAEHVDGPAPDAAAEPREMCVAIADLDHFKRINDTHSHDAGDLVLRRFGALLRSFAAAQRDPATFAARLGGEEFLLGWAGWPLDDALRCCDELRGRLHATSFADIVGAMPVTASIGVACAARPADAGALLRAADLALYEAKRQGRDRVLGQRAGGSGRSGT